MACAGPYRGPLPGHVASHAQPCHCAYALWRAVSQHCCLRPRSRYKNLYRDSICVSNALRAMSRARLVVLQAMSQHVAVVSRRCIAALLCHVTTQRSPLRHDTEFVSRLTPSDQASLLSRYKRLYRDTPHQPGCAQALPHALARGRCRTPLHEGDRVMAYPGHIVACHCTPARPCHALWRARPCLSRYNTLYRDPKLGKWAVAHPASSVTLFFHIIFFFICSTNWKTIKKISFFHVPLEKINSLKCILF